MLCLALGVQKVEVPRAPGRVDDERRRGGGRWVTSGPRPGQKMEAPRSFPATQSQYILQYLASNEL